MPKILIESAHMKTENKIRKIDQDLKFVTEVCKKLDHRIDGLKEVYCKRTDFEGQRTYMGSGNPVDELSQQDAGQATAAGCTALASSKNIQNDEKGYTYCFVVEELLF